MADAYDAIVIGAGPAGGVCAILLACSGWRVAVIEKQTFPRRKVCGECLSAASLPVLDALGIGGRCAALAGAPLREVALICGERMLRAPLPACAGVHRWGVALSREHLDALLLERAAQAGADLFQPWLAYAVEGEPGRFRCRIRAPGAAQERILSAPVLIDAHGAWEPLQAPAAAPHLPADLLGFKANYTGAALEDGLLPVLSFPGGYGGIVMAGAGVATFAFCLRRDALAQARLHNPGRPAAEAAAAWVMRHCAALQPMLQGAHRRDKWLGAGPIRPGVRIGRAPQQRFLIGNAAGEAHPIIGEGITMAMQSAVLLADILAPYRPGLADAPPQARLQADYACAWRRRFAGRIRLAAWFAHAAMRPAGLRAALPLLARHPALLSHFARWCGKARPSTKTKGVSMNTHERVTAILSRQYGLPAERLPPAARLDELGIDSLGVMELLFEIEDEFHIEAPPDRADLQTIADLDRYIDRIVALQTAPAALPQAGK